MLADCVLRILVLFELIRARGWEDDQAWQVVTALLMLPAVFLAPLIGAISNALILWSRTQSLEPENVKGLQTLVVTAVLLAVVLHALARRRGLRRVDLLLLIWALVTWAVPLTQGNISVQRSQAALAPIAVLVARLPRPLLVAAVCVVVAVSVPVARLYFDGLLI